MVRDCGLNQHALRISSAEMERAKHLRGFVPLPDVSSDYKVGNGKAQDLFENLGECGLVDLDELLQFIQVAAEQPKSFVQRDIS